MLRTRRQTARDRGQAGQTLVEFTLVIPIVLLLVMGVLEFGVAFNAFIGLNRASQQAAHLAAIVGDETGADCRILDTIERAVLPPNNRGNILQVEIQRTSLSGNMPLQHIVYQRTGTPRSCALGNGDTIPVPYAAATNSLYPPYPDGPHAAGGQRCDALSGCKSTLGSKRTTVDNIGVAVRYRYDWVTPLASIVTSLPGGAAGWTFTQRNIFRMEPST